MAANEHRLGVPPAAARQLYRLLRGAGVLSLSGFVAFAASTYRAGQSEAHRDARVTAVEQKITTIELQIVPRSEHEAHWRAMEDSQKDLKSDLREVRETQRQILLKLTK